MEDWTTKTKWMREVGAVKATFAESGVLLSVELEPAIPPDDTAEQDQKEDPAKARERLEAERRRIAFAAVGGLVKRHAAE